jgi:hypothetical protein
VTGAEISPPHNPTAGLARNNTAGQFRLEEGERRSDHTGPGFERGVSVNRLRQLSARGLGIAMLVVVVAFFGSLMGAGFASGQSLLPGHGGVNGQRCAMFLSTRRALGEVK